MDTKKNTEYCLTPKITPNNVRYSVLHVSLFTPVQMGQPTGGRCHAVQAWWCGDNTERLPAGLQLWKNTAQHTGWTFPRARHHRGHGLILPLLRFQTTTCLGFVFSLSCLKIYICMLVVKQKSRGESKYLSTWTSCDKENTYWGNSGKLIGCSKLHLKQRRGEGRESSIKLKHALIFVWTNKYMMKTRFLCLVKEKEFLI